MPVVSRQTLRQHVGTLKLRDTVVGTTVFSPNLGVGSVAVVMAAKLVDASLSGNSVGLNWTFRVNGSDYSVASYNVGSGALISGQLVASAVASGAVFEVNQKVAGDDKNSAIDQLLNHMWTRQEIPIDSVSGLLQYSIGTGYKVFGAYYFATPTGTLSRDKHELVPGWDVVTTGSGRELRLAGGISLGASQQLVIDAQVRATLGAADSATLNIPDEDWILNGVAARCYQTLIADAPGKEAGKYTQLAQSYAVEFKKGIGKYRDRINSGWRGVFDEYIP